MTETKKTLIKTGADILGAVAGFGVSSLVGNIVGHNIAVSEDKKITKACIAVGGGFLGLMAADLTENYISRKADEFINDFDTYMDIPGVKDMMEEKEDSDGVSE